jgi:hypothetical protein
MAFAIDADAPAPPAKSVHTAAPNLKTLPPAPASEIPSENGASAEPVVFSNMFPQAAPRVMVSQIPTPPKPTIPDDVMVGSPKVGDRSPLPEAVLAAFRTADAAVIAMAQQFADRRAATLLIALERSATAKQAVPRTHPLVIREYASPRPGSSDPAAFDADTVLWQPLIVLPTDGRTTLHFNLGNAKGGYQVLVAGHSADGRLGSTRTLLPIR